MTYAVAMGNTYFAPQDLRGAQGAVANQVGIMQAQGEPSLTGELGNQLLMGTAVMSAMSAPKLFQSTSGAARKFATTEFANLQQTKGFKNLSALEKGKAYSTLFNAERLSNGKVFTYEALGFRGEAANKALQDIYNSTLKNYQTALQAGDKVGIARYSAELETFTSLGKRKGFFTGIMDKFHKTETPLFQSVEHIQSSMTAAGDKAAAHASEMLKAAESAPALTGTAKATAEAGAKATAKAGAKVTAEAGVKAAAQTSAGLSKTGAWLTDAFKSGGFKGFLIFSGAIECFTKVLPAFQNGFGSGITQLLKSGANVSADAAGWCVGAKIGAGLGATLGSIVPGAGNAFGAFLGGIVGGLAGAFLTRKVVSTTIDYFCPEEQQATQQMQAQQMPQGQFGTNVAPNGAMSRDELAEMCAADGITIEDLDDIFIGGGRQTAIA